jgi:hypothetical protein
MRSPLEIYLRNHEAAGRAGCSLFARVARSHSGEAYAAELDTLRREIREDLTTLRGIMRRAQVHPDLVLGTALQVGERVGRLKPNGRLVRPSPLTPLIEIEALLDAVHAKSAGWWALDAAGLGATIAPELASLKERAASQVERLRTLHATVAASVLPKSG